MYGDILFVERKRLKLNQSFRDTRMTPYSKILDHLVVKLISFTHYGIEVEDGMVIHFIIRTLHNPKECIIEKVPIKEFLKDGYCQVQQNVNYAFPRDEIVRRAYSQLGTKFEGYRVHNNNCEHFAYWCATGEKVASQSRFLVAYNYVSKAPGRTADYGRRAGSRAKTVSQKVWKICTSFYK